LCLGVEEEEKMTALAEKKQKHASAR
jgi:hypothetical protein